jgi:hypothetical protein
MEVEGERLLRYRSVDRAGNVEEAQSVNIYNDNEPPETGSEVPAEPVNELPYTVNLSVTDVGCGVRVTYYTTDGNDPDVSSSQGTEIEITEEGSYVLKYYSVDYLGNVEAVKVAENELVVDVTAPEAVSVNEVPELVNEAELEIKGSRPVDGVRVEVKLNGEEVGGVEYPDEVSWRCVLNLAEGENVIEVACYDLAGNKSEVVEVRVVLDSVVPSSSVGELGEYQREVNFEVEYSANDGEGSGVAYVELYYRIGGSGEYEKYVTADNPEGQWTSSPIGFVAGIDGRYEFYTVAVDVAGNVEEVPENADEVTVVDTIAPGVVELVAPEANAEGVEGCPEFSWREVSDVNGVRYVLAWAKDEDFEVDVEVVEGIEGLSYRVPEDKKLESEREYWWRVRAVDGAGNEGEWSEVRRFERNLRIVVVMKELPEESVLIGNRPNPFNPETWIEYGIGRGKRERVKVRIYNVLGQLVREMDLGIKEAGWYRVRSRAIYWDGRDNKGQSVGGGIYFCQLIAGEKVMMRRMVILK